jgi:hypothetical protein
VEYFSDHGRQGAGLVLDPRQIGMHCKPGDRWASWFADHGLVPRTKIISEWDEPERRVDYTEALDPGRAAVVSWSPPPGLMGRVGACADNAAMESFVSLLQKNVLNRRRWASRGQLRLAIATWIERTYHRRRRQDASADSPRSSSRHSTTPLLRPDRTDRPSQQKSGRPNPAGAPLEAR